MRKASVYPALQISPPHLLPGTGHMNKENRLKKDIKHKFSKSAINAPASTYSI